MDEDLKNLADAFLAAMPKHECELMIMHNDHKSCYETVEQYCNYREHHMNWVSGDEHKLAIKNDELWTVIWYPFTPIGSYTLNASSLSGLLIGIREFEGRTMDDIKTSTSTISDADIVAEAIRLTEYYMSNRRTGIASGFVAEGEDVAIIIESHRQQAAEIDRLRAMLARVNKDDIEHILLRELEEPEFDFAADAIVAHIKGE